MKNLDQIRAQSALRHKDKIANAKGGGDAISGFPMRVLTDGILAALAFSCEWKDKEKGQRKNPGQFTVATAIADHLSLDGNPLVKGKTADDLVKELAAGNDDQLLRRATAEALAFLNYLKRFVA